MDAKKPRGGCGQFSLIKSQNPAAVVTADFKLSTRCTAIVNGNNPHDAIAHLMQNSYPNGLVA